MTESSRHSSAVVPNRVAVARGGTRLRRARRTGDLAAAVAVRDARVACRRVAAGLGRDQAVATVAGAASRAARRQTWAMILIQAGLDIAMGMLLFNHG